MAGYHNTNAFVQHVLEAPVLRAVKTSSVHMSVWHTYMLAGLFRESSVGKTLLCTH